MRNFHFPALNFTFSNEIGQSLLEVTVLVGLALITITGLVIVTVNGLKNSQYSQNQAQATRLAQEGIDQVKSMASRNCSVSISGNYFWFNSLTNGSDLVWNRNWSAGPTFYISNYNSCDTTTPGLIQTNAAHLHDIDPSVSGGLFTRDIAIQDDLDLITGSSNCSPSTSCKRITVSVSWNDYSGNHLSKLVTVLTEN